MADHGSSILEIYPTPSGALGVEAYFCALWTEPGHRRKGIGKALLAKAEEITRELGYDALYLRVYDNEAEGWCIQFYERQNYEIVAEGVDYSEMRKMLK